jgi:hypothetical protein
MRSISVLFCLLLGLLVCVGVWLCKSQLFQYFGHITGGIHIVWFNTGLYIPFASILILLVICTLLVKLGKR